MKVAVTSDAGTTRRTVERLYEAYLGGNPGGMADVLSEDAWVRFLGHADIRGREAARTLFVGNESLLSDLQFNIELLIVDGELAAVIWSEQAITRDGAPWFSHGVDVFRVVDGELVFMHENNDVANFRRHFPD